jgi:hypothetical protein
MRYSLSCVDMGVVWCKLVLHGATQDELLAAVIEHGREHGREHAQLTPEELVTPEFRALFKNAMVIEEDA